MAIDIELRDEADELLETSKMEYLKRRNSVSAKMEDKLFIFDSDKNMTLNIDYKSKSIQLAESNNGDLVSTQLRTMITMFDENEALFEVAEEEKNGLHTYLVSINSELLAYYAFSKTERLSEVIFYQMGPQYIDGVEINPIMKMDFKYDVNIAISNFSKFIQKTDGRWVPKPAFDSFEFSDKLSYKSNDN